MSIPIPAFGWYSRLIILYHFSSMVMLQANVPSKKLIMAVGLTAFLLALAGGAYYLYVPKTNTPHKLSKAKVVDTATEGTSNSSPNPTINSHTNQATVTPTTDPYQGWKDYTQAETYTFKYPGGWLRGDEVGAPSYPDSAIVTNQKIKYPGQLTSTGIFLAVNVTNTPVDRDQLVLNSPVGNISKNQYSTKYDILTKLGETKIDGYDAVYFTEDFSADPTVRGGYEYIYLVQKGSKYYQISFDMNNHDAYNSHSNEINKLVGSFTFK